MVKLIIIITFWTDGKPNSDRIRNANLSWDYAKRLGDFLNKNNISTKCKLYDFSPHKLLEESIHIPFNLGEYKRSQKLNIIIDQNNESDYMMFIDCDVLFQESDFNKVLDILKNIKPLEIYTFDLAKLDKKDTLEFIKNPKTDISKLNWKFAYTLDKSNGPLYGHAVGSLGGCFIINTNLIKNHGKFNESLTTWGKEDAESMSNLMTSRIGVIPRPVKTFFPIHLYHFTDWGNLNYYNNKQ